MIKDNAGEMMMIDGKTVSMKNGKKYEAEGIKIYEVVRVIEGKPLFLKEHMGRLENSFKVLNMEVPQKIKSLGGRINEFLKQARVLNGNIKIICDGIGGTENRTIIYEAVSSYPDRALRENGVVAATLEKSRTSPGAKTMQDDLRMHAENARLEKNAYEVVFVDSEDNITEGSRSNIFFFKDGILHTPPYEKVLPGITRMKVFEFCAKKGIEAKVHPIKRKDLNNFDGAFLTGTSINMLPVKSIDEIEYAVTGFAIELPAQFERYILEDALNA